MRLIHESAQLADQAETQHNRTLYTQQAYSTQPFTCLGATCQSQEDGRLGALHGLYDTGNHVTQNRLAVIRDHGVANLTLIEVKPAPPRLGSGRENLSTCLRG